jgi:hypothetical protein
MNHLLTPYGLMVTSVTEGGTQKLPKRLSKHTDMTIHWKALEEHFLLVPFPQKQTSTTEHSSYIYIAPVLSNDLLNSLPSIQPSCSLTSPVQATGYTNTDASWVPF